MIEATIRKKIQDKLNKLDLQELIFVDRVLTDITTYLNQKDVTENSINNPQNQDSSISLKDSDFIGCFADDPDLSEKSEHLANLILSKQNPEGL